MKEILLDYQKLQSHTQHSKTGKFRQDCQIYDGCLQQTAEFFCKGCSKVLSYVYIIWSVSTIYSL